MLQYTPVGELQKVNIPMTNPGEGFLGLADSINNHIKQQEANKQQEAAFKQQQMLADRINAYTESNNALNSTLQSINSQRTTQPTVNVNDVRAAVTPASSTYTFNAPNPLPVDTQGRALGWAARMSETGSDYGKHGGYSRNDGGGASLGLYQLHSAKGSMTKFLEEEVAKANPELYTQLKALFPKNASDYSKDFLTLWNNNEAVLRPLQHSYAKRVYYDNPLASLSNSNLRDLIVSDPRLKEAFFSFNVNGSQRAFKSLTGTESPYDALKKVYEYRTQGLDANDRRPRNFYTWADPELAQKIHTNVMREYSRLLGAY